jgi:dynein heavy chain
MGAKRRYVNGLEKLAYAEIEVAQMSKDLEALQPQLKVAAEEAEVMIGVIEVESKQAGEQADQVQKEEAAANEKAAAAQALKVTQN